MTLLDRTAFTAVIPAAGKGSRLGYDLPKILFPVAGRPIIDWLGDLLAPFCSRLVFVLSPSGRDAVEHHLRGADFAWHTVAQPEPIGMADAVERGLEIVATPFAAVIWGDQAGVQARSLEECLRAHQSRPGAAITFPTLLRPDPYIHFERDSDDRIVAVRQRREGDVMPAVGESDAGLFIVSVNPMRAALGDMALRQRVRGQATGELNFLPFIPQLDCGSQEVRGLRGILAEEETLGVNTRDDAERLGQWLRGRALSPA